MGVALQNASSFLKRWNMRVEDLTRYVRPLDPTETLVLVGSVPEGLANPLSDVDMFIIGDRKFDEGIVVNESDFQEMSINTADAPEINVEYWHSNDLEKLEKRMANLFSLLRDPSLVGGPSKLKKVERFDFSELLIMHRIRTGIVLANPGIAESWRERLYLDQLPLYIILHGLGTHNIYREDTIAQVRYGDNLSALGMLHIMMDHLASAILASVGETNPYPKWRMRLLNWYKGDLGEETIENFVRYMFPNPKEPASETVRGAFKFADSAVAGIASRCPQAISAMLEMNNLFTILKQPDEISQQERSAKRG
jgi:predicted nucleotidyltransferase